MNLEISSGNEDAVQNSKTRWGNERIGIWCFSLSADKSNRKASTVISNWLKKRIGLFSNKHSESVQNKAIQELFR